MDALGDLLEPHTELIAKVAGTITCMQFLSGVALVNDIRKQGSSDRYPVGPFLGGIVLTVLSLKLGQLMGDQAMINVNIIGFGLNALFLFAFYYYASDGCKSQIWQKIGYASLFLMCCIAYANFDDPANVEFRFGMLITVILVCLVGSPLLELHKVIEKKSVEGWPFPIIVAGHLVSLSWLCYGLAIRNTVVVYQNLLLAVLSGIQLFMFAIYPSKPAAAASKAKSKSKSPTKRD